jgi:hypothetical protein
MSIVPPVRRADVHLDDAVPLEPAARGGVMVPWFTSRQEWEQLRSAGGRAYVRSSVGWMLRAGALGIAVLVVLGGATDPYWRSAPFLGVAVASLVAGALCSALLFHREWNAAERTYGAC